MHDQRTPAALWLADEADLASRYRVWLTGQQILDFAELVRSVASGEIEHPLPDVQALPLLAFLNLLPAVSDADLDAWLAEQDRKRAVGAAS